MEGVIGLEVVLADGTIARTGSWALNQTPAFMRQCGPDLTGMFIGDGGSLAVKTAVVLRLVPERDLSFASFSYASPEQLMADLVRIQRLGCVTRLLALDRHKGEQARKVDTAEAIKVAGAVASKSGSALQAVRHVASLVRGRRDLGRAQWTLHLTAEGETPDIARARINLARTICGENAEEIEDLVPRASAARPFSIRGFLGPQGERWVPIHGIVPLSRAFATLAALKSYFDRIADELSELGIERSMLMSSSGAFVTIEPMFLWPDELDPIHFEHLADRHRERFGGRPANPQARAAVMRYRSDLRAIFEQQGAVHVQLARFYRYADRLDAGSLALLKRLQKAVDPDFRLNPGALGLTL
jgi:D-lactate dehydrogenase (cytochrome)